MDSKVTSSVEPTKEHLKILNDKFGINEFKKEQWNAISAVMFEQRDVFICAKSAFGKSLIYQYPPVFLGKKSLVISPQISLMETQVQKLAALGISACSISGQQKGAGLNLKEYSVIYSTPENFTTIRGILKWAENDHEICLVAIDEAHCISKSSADHRPAFSILRNIKESFPNIPIVALTSTASNDTTANVCSFLELKDPLMLKTPLDRPNIKYFSTNQTFCFITDVKRFLLDMPKNEAAIIYVFKRAETENYSQILTREGFESKPYHSGLIEEIRRETLREFMSGRLNFLVTTNAFGMGVDRPDVRVVIHYGVPKNPSTYYMESGRAGRDGKPATSVIFWSDKDYKFHNYCFKENFKNKFVSHQSYGHCQQLLTKMKEYTITKKCRRAMLLGYLDETYPSVITESCCDNCLETLHKEAGLSKMYKEINVDGLIDVTKDLRTVLGLIHSYQGKCKSEIIVDFITGSLLPEDFDPKHPVEYFGCGRNKAKSWWLNIMKIIKEKRFTERHTVVTNTNNMMEIIAQIGITRDDYVRTTTKGIKFLRVTSKKCLTYPRLEYYPSMTKTDTEYYIINGVLKERPRGYQGSYEEEPQEPEKDDKAFDFSGFTSHLNKNSPRKRLASESETSECSLTELFKSPRKDEDVTPKGSKVPRINNDQPGCSSWSTAKSGSDPVGRVTRNSTKMKDAKDLN